MREGRRRLGPNLTEGKQWQEEKLHEESLLLVESQLRAGVLLLRGEQYVERPPLAERRLQRGERRHVERLSAERLLLRGERRHVERLSAERPLLRGERPHVERRPLDARLLLRGERLLAERRLHVESL
tara:strand:+ start:797 stop:1180 length:384 start_codon:yes stop_codon:yes gene_type:complete